MKDREAEERERRQFYKRAKRCKDYKEFWGVMNAFHTRAYRLAAKHMSEAADITLQPKQKQLLFAKFDEIRELWDGMDAVITPETVKRKLGEWGKIE